MATDVPEVVRISASGIYDGEEVVNVFHLWKRDDSAITQANLVTIQGLLTAAAANQYSLNYFYNNQDDALLINRIYMRTLSNAAAHELDVATSIPGTATGTGGPPMLTMMVKWGTDVAARRRRGRTYLPGITLGNISTTDADRFLTAYITAQQTRFSNFVAAWIANTAYGLVVLSAKDRKENVANPYAEILSAAVDPLVRAQVRRRSGHR